MHLVDEAGADSLELMALSSAHNLLTAQRWEGAELSELVAQAMAAIVRDIDYSNFKAEVVRQQDRSREVAYHKVWEVAQPH